MKDIKHDANGDIDLSSGDIVWVDSTKQHQRDIILTAQGLNKRTPARGVGAENYFNDDSPEDFLRKIRQEFIKDGQTVNSITEDSGTITIDGGYE